MNGIWEYLFLRRMSLSYTAPPVCEVIFSGSSNPVIILSNRSIGKVTGLVLGGFSGFRLSWNAFPGAICYNIYHIAPGTDVAVLLAECVQPGYELPNPGPGPGEVIITPITPDEGEGEPSDPIPYPTPGGGGTSEVIVERMCAQTSRDEFPGTFRISRAPGDTIGNLVVHYTMSGSAVNGTDYDLIPLQATIPNGSEFVLVDIVPVEPVLGDKSVILTLDESLSYAVGTPSFSSVNIRLAILQIIDYGGAQALFTPPPEALDSILCEWDGTWNTNVNPTLWYWTDENNTFYFGNASVQDKAIFSSFVSGPFAHPTPGTYQLSVQCRDEFNNLYIVWQGLKQGGDITTPEGIYLWNGFGSDHRASVEIEVT